MSLVGMLSHFAEACAGSLASKVQPKACGVIHPRGRTSLERLRICIWAQ